MASADLHVHSKYSNHPSEWFLQRLGASESYTEPDQIYKMARKRGMDFVTVTDHNRIKASLELVKKHPKRCFTGVESTAYFPEDNCKVHILIYGLDREQFTKIQKHRLNIYKLRDYLKKEDLACVVAHATYSVNGKLTLDHLEKLILLFNNFEGRNGSRSILHNDVLSRVLTQLTRTDIERLQAKHAIDPWGPEPWKKSLTGGSDDHAGLFIAKTSTQAKAATPAEFLEQLKRGRTQPQGRQNDFQGLTFAIYKIAFDFSQHKSTAFAKSTISDLSSYLFDENKKLSFRDRLRLNKMRSKKNNAIYQNIVHVIENSRKLHEDDIDTRLDLLYDCISDISDEYFRSLLKSLNTNLEEMDIIQIIQGLSSSIPGIFLSIPFFSAFKHMFGDRQLINSLDESLGKQTKNQPKKILWLTDTLTDLNGVSMTLQTIGKLAEEKKLDIRIMSSLTQEQLEQDLPKTTLSTPPIFTFQLPHYENLNINVPSVLRMLKQVYTYNPDEIYISTPGPVGMLGMLIGRMLGTEVKGIYHTDFTMEADAIIAEPAVSSMIEQYSKWFFNQFDTLLVPTKEYMGVLKERGYRHRHMEQFRRGLRTEHFKPMGHTSSRQRGMKLLYVGRISKDKNLDFLMDTYRQLKVKHTDISLTFAGIGPYLEELTRDCAGTSDVTFLGQVPYHQLPELYNQHDLFLFPSITDTFGMVVLEAQACGIPALVSDVGGPKEIVEEGETGFVISVDDPQPWVDRISDLICDFNGPQKHWKQLSQAARTRVEENFNWDTILKNMVSTDPSLSKHHRHRHQPSLKRILKLASNMMVH